ncbi:hypothetical protein FOFC_09772 [Fusarium oxysporum]|nr:hypothetical protein FOFC_09772 [Fusarium oxysporum]
MRHGKIMSLGRPKKKRRFHGMSLFRATGISGTSVTGGLRGTAEPSCGLASGPHRGPKWRVWTTDRVRAKSHGSSFKVRYEKAIRHCDVVLWDTSKPRIRL